MLLDKNFGDQKYKSNQIGWDIVYNFYSFKRIL